jgi:hypothetical protein
MHLLVNIMNTRKCMVWLTQKMYYILLSHTIWYLHRSCSTCHFLLETIYEHFITLHVYHAAYLIYFHTFSIDLGIIFIAGDLACPFSWHISHKKFDVLSTSLPPIALQHSVKEETIYNQYHKQCLSGFSWKFYHSFS